MLKSTFRPDFTYFSKWLQVSALIEVRVYVCFLVCQLIYFKNVYLNLKEKDHAETMFKFAVIAITGFFLMDLIHKCVYVYNR